MKDFETVKSWVEQLGLRIKGESENGGLEVAVSTSGAPRFAIKPAGETSWLIEHRRRITLSTVDSDWKIGAESESPVQLLTKSTYRLATSFPLVQTDVIQRDSDIVIEFTAPLLWEGLAGQTFALTLSSVMKAVEAFDLLSEQRAEQAARWREYTVQEAELLKKQEEQLAEFKEVMAKKARIASVKGKIKCPHCGVGMSEDALFCASCGRRLRSAR